MLRVFVEVNTAGATDSQPTGVRATIRSRVQALAPNSYVCSATGPLSLSVDPEISWASWYFCRAGWGDWKSRVI